MQSIVQKIVEMFGLNYQPQTFGDLFVWFVTVMCAVCLVAGIIKLFFYICTNVGRIGR